MAYELSERFKHEQVIRTILPSGKKVNFGTKGKLDVKSQPTKKHPNGKVVVWEKATKADIDLFFKLGSQRIFVETKTTTSVTG